MSFKKKNQLKNDNERSRGFYRTLLRVALPLSLQSLIASSLSLVDNLMVGKLGETELAAVGLSTQIFFVFWMILFGFTGGAITYMAQLWGKRDLVNIRRVTGIALTVSFGIGVLFFTLGLFFPRFILGIFTDIPRVLELGVPWIRLGSIIFLTWSIVVPLTALLRATQQTSIPLKISIVVFCTNTGLGLVLIYGFLGMPKMGIMGACTATVISRALELLLYIYVIFIRKNFVAGPIKEFFSWNKDLLRRVIRNAVPTTINEMMWGLGTAMYSSAIGHMSEIEFAAYQAGYTILNLFSLFCFSIGDAMLILVGEKLGAGKLEEGYRMAMRILKVGVVIGLVAGGLLIGLSQPVVSLFGFSAEGIKLTHYILYVFAGFLFLKVFNSAVVVGALRSGGDTRFAMLCESATIWCIGVPVAFVCALLLGFPVYLVVLCIQVEELVKFTILWRRLRSRKWLNDLVDY
ncbi:MAG: MATE family efflux transporter [Clostridiales Family XIII bacterium]|nr:MATE family efflux transporter [Clostridiales Family XIII bacterium]